MAKTQKLLSGLALLAIVLWVVAPPAAAQQLDGKWYKLVCHFQGIKVNPSTGEHVKVKFDLPAYIHFSFTGAGTAPFGVNYKIQLWCKTAPGVWSVVSTLDFISASTCPDVFPDRILTYTTQFGDSIAGFSTPIVTLAPDLYRATGEIIAGHDNFGHQYFGGITITGSSVVELPFHPL